MPLAIDFYAMQDPTQRAKLLAMASNPTLPRADAEALLDRVGYIHEEDGSFFLYDEWLPVAMALAANPALPAKGLVTMAEALPLLPALTTNPILPLLALEDPTLADRVLSHAGGAVGMDMELRLRESTFGQTMIDRELHRTLAEIITAYRERHGGGWRQEWSSIWDTGPGVDDDETFLIDMERSWDDLQKLPDAARTTERVRNFVRRHPAIHWLGWDAVPQFLSLVRGWHQRQARLLQELPQRSMSAWEPTFLRLAAAVGMR